MSRWLGDYDAVYRAPEENSSRTEREKIKILKSRSTDLEKKKDLMNLCMSEKETIYVNALNGIYRFRYNVRNDGTGYVQMDYGKRILDEHLKTRHIYRFGTMGAGDLPMTVYEKQGLFKGVTCDVALSDIAESSQNRDIIIPIHEQIPYDSLLVEGYPDKYNYRDMDSGIKIKDVKLMSVEEAEETVMVNDHSGLYYSARQQEFIDLCNKLITERKSQAPRYWIDEMNYRIDMYCKEQGSYNIICPDEIAIDEKAVEMAENDYKYNEFEAERLKIGGNDFLLADEATRKKMINEAADMIRTLEHCGDPTLKYTGVYRFVYEAKYGVAPTGNRPFREIYDKVLEMNYADLFYIKRGMRPQYIKNVPEFFNEKSYEVRLSKAPADIQDRARHEKSAFYGGKAKPYYENRCSRFMDDINEKYYKEAHGEPFNVVLPDDADRKLDDMRSEWTKQSREKEIQYYNNEKSRMSKRKAKER